MKKIKVIMTPKEKLEYNGHLVRLGQAKTRREVHYYFKKAKSMIDEALRRQQTKKEEEKLEKTKVYMTPREKLEYNSYLVRLKQARTKREVRYYAKKAKDMIDEALKRQKERG